MLKLRYDTPVAYRDVVRANLDAFLQDHAANERKVASSALQLAVHNPERTELVSAMIELAEEEFQHFRQVYELLVSRGKGLAQDVPDPYVGAIRREIRRAYKQHFLLDRLVAFAVIEARGCERFSLVAQAVEEPSLRAFYEELVRSESRHHAVYLRLARLYFPAQEVATRLDHFLQVEAEVVARLPLRPALH